MQLTQKTLSNGLRALSVYMPESLSQTTLVLVGVGSNFETEDEAGISHFLEHMCFKGTVKRPTPLSVARAFDALGAQSNAFTDRQVTGYYGKTAKDAFPDCLDILADVYLNSTLPEAELEKEKGVIIDEIRMYKDEPQARVNFLFDELLYPNMPHGRMIAGTEETVRSMTRGKMEQYRSRFYNTQNTVVVVAGGVPSEKVFSEIEKQFALAPQGEKTKILPIQNMVGERIATENQKTEQAHIIIGGHSFGAESPDRYAGSVLATILGGNMSSRLFQKIREEMGVGYYVHATQSLEEGYGCFSAAAGVTPDRLTDVVRAIVNEFETIQNTKISEEELTLAKNYIASHIALSKESNENVAMRYANAYLFGHPLHTFEERIASIHAVTVEDVSRVARQVLSQANLQLAVIGPVPDGKALLPLLG